MSNIPPEALADMYAQSTTSAYLLTLEVNHPSLAEPYRFVNDREALTYNNVTYSPLWMDFNLAPSTLENDPELSITVDAVDRALIDMLRSVVAREITVTYSLLRVDDAGNISEVLPPVSLLVVSVSFSVTTLELRCSLENASFSSSAVKDYFTPTVAPGLFR